MHVNSICIAEMYLHNCRLLYFFMKQQIVYCTCSVFRCGLTKMLLVGRAESSSCSAGTRNENLQFLVIPAHCHVLPSIDIGLEHAMVAPVSVRIFLKPCFWESLVSSLHLANETKTTILLLLSSEKQMLSRQQRYDQIHSSIWSIVKVMTWQSHNPLNTLFLALGPSLLRFPVAA